MPDCGVRFAVHDDRQFCTMPEAVLGIRLVRNKLLKKLALPSDASSSFTGFSRTEATKQNEAGSMDIADGYQMKSRIGDG